MSSISLLQSAVIGLYLAASALYPAATLLQRGGWKKLAMALSLAGFVLHTAHLGVVTSQPGDSLVQGNFYLSLFSWVLILIYFLAWFRLRIGFLALTVSPLALIFYIASLAFPGRSVLMPRQLSGLFFGLHIGSLFLAIALMALAFGAGLAFLSVEKRIKSKEKLRGFQKDLPSLSTFDGINRICTLGAFPLYTLGLVSGFVWAKATWNRVFTWDPKEVVALAIWFLFAYLFYRRSVSGWQGRKTAILAIWIFILTVVSMVGINFLLPTHHSFSVTPMPALP